MVHLMLLGSRRDQIADGPVDVVLIACVCKLPMHTHCALRRSSTPTLCWSSLGHFLRLIVGLLWELNPGRLVPKSESYTKPSSQLQTLQVCWVPDVAASTAFVEALSRKAEHCELDNSVVVTRKKLSTMIRQQSRFFGSCTAFQMGYGVPRAIPCAYEVHVLAWHPS